ncbi:acyltransferase family protein [Enterobacter cloacae]
MNQSGKIIFADQLRVLAFLSVLLTHWVGVFWVFPDTISFIVKAPSTGISTWEYLNKILLPLPYFDYGNIGVAIFFLISGFVIPFSLRSKSTKGFLISRLARIYPTYITCLLMSICFLYFTSKYYWQSDAGFSLWNILSNLTLTHPYFNQLTMDGVNWTLAIEVFFYVVVAIFRKNVISGSCSFIIIMALTFGLFISLVSNTTKIYHIYDVNLSIDGLKMSMLFILYMFIGTLFHFHIDGRIGTKKLVSHILIIFAIMLTSWYYSPFEDQFLKTPVNYTYTLVIFSACYFTRNLFKQNKVLSFLSGISYPFYAIHSIIGYSILRILFDKGMQFSLSFAIAFVVVLLLSTIVHFTVEKWSINFGKRFK